MTSKDRIHAEWCLCPACRPLGPGERASPLTMALVWGTSLLAGAGLIALAVAALARLLMAADLVMGRPDAPTLLRARTKTVQAAALCLAEIDRLDRRIRKLTLHEEGNHHG